MSKKSQPPKGGKTQAKKQAPKEKDKGKAQPAKKSSKKRKQNRLEAFLNSRYGVMLVGALVIFGVLMCFAGGSAGAGLLLIGNRLAEEQENSTPVLIAAPPVALSPPPTATPVLHPTSEETPAEEPTEEDTHDPPPSPTTDHEPTPDGALREGRVPILMYHYVSTPPEDADIYRLDLSVTPPDFEEQMRWLDENGCTTITLYQFADWLARGAELPERPVVLTFDDGYVDNYEIAFPIMQKYGHVGTFFILTGATEAGNPDYMSWDMLREMDEAGMSIEMHGHDHLEMSGRDFDFLAYQMDNSAGILEERLGHRPRFFAYPGGKYDDNAIQALQDADYWLALTTQYGWLHATGEEYELKRVRIRGEYSLGQFAELLNSAFKEPEAAEEE